jgi:hypothetical protein
MTVAYLSATSTLGSRLSDRPKRGGDASPLCFWVNPIEMLFVTELRGRVRLRPNRAFRAYLPNDVNPYDTL